MSERRDPNKNNLINVVDAPYTERGGGAMIRHIDTELQALKDLASQMGDTVEMALANACDSILAKGADQCFTEVNRFEARINDLQILIDESCVNVLAKQAPVAKDLRLVIAITKINTDLERMGDQSVSIARSACDLHKRWPGTNVPAEIIRMIEEVRHMVRSALDAFAKRDIVTSQRVLEQDDVVDNLRDTLIHEQKENMKSGPDAVETGLAFIMMAKNLERMADHATNIAEEVIYLATGNDVRHGHHVLEKS